MKHLLILSFFSFFTFNLSAQETGGCNYPWACNYDPDADYYLPGACEFGCYGGATLPLNENLCLTGVGCMDESAINYDPEAMSDTPTSCFYSEEDIDFNNDGIIGAADLVVFLSYYGGVWP